LARWFWTNVVTDARIGAELSTKYKGGHGIKEESTNGHFCALDAISERVALAYIASSRCLDVTDLEEQSWITRCNPKEGGRLLSQENRDSRNQYVGKWQWDLGPNKPQGSKKSQVKLGYPMEIDHQVCSKIHKTGTGY
jgi:hypothetical protein